MTYISIAVASHDSSICFGDTDKNLHYYLSAERLFNSKHASIAPTHIMNQAFKILNIDHFDYGCIVPNYLELTLEKTELVKQLTNSPYRWKIGHFIEIDHHLAHALSSQFSTNNILTQGIGIDGTGHHFRRVTSFNDLNDFNKITYDTSSTLEFGHLFKYLAKIYNLVADGPGKFMGLQSYGNKIDSSFYEELQSAGINNYEQLKEILSNHLSGIDIYNKNYNQNDMDKIYTSHKFLEDEIVNVFNRFDKSKEIGYSGGCALNTVTNTRLLNEGYKLSICPAANDAGLSIGGVVALNYFFNLNIDVHQLKSYCKLVTKTISSDTINFIADALALNKIVAFCEGPDEIGPRALGHRSILMNPSIKNGKDFINDKVKHREWWRPFGGTVISTEMIEDYSPSNLDPYMLRNFVIKESYRKDYNSICHVDNTSRLQILKDENSSLYKIIDKFKQYTGLSGVLNTSFNSSGKPIPSSRQDIMNTIRLVDNIDYLIINDQIFHTN